MGQAITLQVFRGNDLVSTQTFDRDVIKIGRLPSAQLRLEDLKVARIHAVIEIPAGGKEFFLQDMGSAEGTFLNGEKIKRQKLKDGDQIVVGDTRLVATLGASAPKAAAPVQQQPAMAASQRSDVTQVGISQAQLLQMQQHQVQLQAQAALQRQANPGQTRLPQQAAVPGQPAVAPNFDPRTIGFSEPLERVDNSIMDHAAFDEGSDEHGELQPEQPVSADNRALELRMYWGDIILDINHLEMPKHAKQITIGETGKTDIFISSEGLPKEEFPLIRYLDDNYILTFFNDLEGEVQIDGELKSLKEARSSSRVRKDDDLDGCYQLPMDYKTKAIVHWGGLTMAMRFVPPPQKMVGAPLNVDFQFMNILVIVFFLMVGSIFTLSLYPYDAEALSEELMKSDNKFAQFILEPPKPIEQQKQAQEFLDRMKEKEAKGPSKAKGDDGKFGKDKAKEVDAHSSVKAIKPDDKEVIKNSGLFKALGGGSFSQIIGSTSGLGGEVSNALGNLTGKTAGDSGGLGGLGLKGTGPGGGGIGDSIGLAKGVSTSGKIGGTASYGSDQGKLGAKKDTDINLADAAPIVQGSLDPALIKKVIQENRNAIRYCYERELQVKKDLSGVIKTQFIISPTGSVSMSVVKESSMKNPNVENCIAQKIRGLIFPKPKGGGIVIVNYPFVFKSAGG